MTTHCATLCLVGWLLVGGTLITSLPAPQENCDKRYVIHPIHGKQLCSQLCSPTRTDKRQIDFCRNNCHRYYEECGPGAVTVPPRSSTPRSSIIAILSTSSLTKLSDLQPLTSDRQIDDARAPVHSSQNWSLRGIIILAVLGLLLVVLVTVAIVILKKLCPKLCVCSSTKFSVPETGNNPEEPLNPDHDV